MSEKLLGSFLFDHPSQTFVNTHQSLYVTILYQLKTHIGSNITYAYSVYSRPVEERFIVFTSRKCTIGYSDFTHVHRRRTLFQAGGYCFKQADIVLSRRALLQAGGHCFKQAGIVSRVWSFPYTFNGEHILVASCFPEVNKNVFDWAAQMAQERKPKWIVESPRMKEGCRHNLGRNLLVKWCKTLSQTKFPSK